MKAIFSKNMSTANCSPDLSSSSLATSCASPAFLSHPPTKSANKLPAIAGQGHYTQAFVHDEDPEELCPVCHEDISLRLQGEKPHVVPSCGHKLHAVCFENVYTTIAEARKTSGVYGCCGTCRKDMRLGDVVSGGPSPRTHATTVASFLMGIDSVTSSNLGSKKLVAMTGGLDSIPRLANHKVHSVTRKAALAAAAASTPATIAIDNTQDYDPDNDDELSNILDDHSSAWSDPSPRQYRKPSQVIQPVIQAISESSSLAQQNDIGQAQHITCMVSIEIPSRYPTQPLVLTPSSATFSSVHSPLFNPSFASCSVSGRSRPSLPSILSAAEYENVHSFPPPEFGRACPKVKSYPTLGSTTPSIRSGTEPSSSVGLDADMAHSMAENLLSRIQNWKGHSLSDFGTLKLCDRLDVRKEYKSREFLVYLFEEALLCVSEDLSRPMGGNSQSSSARLRLKGRVYIRHMTSVHDSSAESPLTLTIKMEDDNMDAFVMLFRERAQLKLWLKTLELLIHKHLPDPTRERMPLPAIPTSRAASSETPPCGEGLHMTTADGRAEAYTSSDGGYASSSFTGYTRATTLTSAPTLSSVGEEHAHDDRQSFPNRHPTRCDSFGHSVTSSHHHTLHSESVFESTPFHSLSILTTPEPVEKVSPMLFNSALGAARAFHVGDLAPIDLLLMISIPGPHAVSALAPMPSSANMKLRLIKECLQSIIRNLHPRSRLSLIVYSVGNSNDSRALNSTGRCQLRKIPFLSVGRESSRRRLEYVIEQVGKAGHCSNILNCENERYYGEFFDEALQDYTTLEGRLKMAEIDQGPERISVVTAVNLAYDNILQRKQKNPLTGMLLIHDTHDLSTKDQMALVMTRAESSNVPIHTIGWGKAHNPSSLLQISNHTGGTYSFVKDLPTIKDVVTGCIGGMLSVAATNAKLRISVPEHIWFKIKKLSGVERFVLSSNGQNADVELGELRYGERRDILLEMEMSSGGGKRGAGDDVNSRGRFGSTQALTGTDAFFLQHGAELKEIGMGDGGGTLEFYEAEFNQLCDDVPLLEVDASYKDPIAGKSVSRLVRPVLLSLTITPPRPMMNSTLGAGTLGGSNEPAIVRRRVELLTAGCLSRAMLLISRRLERQADRLLDEARTIVLTVLGSGERVSGGGLGRAVNRKTRDEALAKEILAGCLHDLETMLVAVEELTRIAGEASVETSISTNEADRIMNEERMIAAYHSFDSDTRNLIAQQAGVLRNQRAWTGRTLTESKFWKADRSIIYSLRCMHFSSA